MRIRIMLALLLLSACAFSSFASGKKEIPSGKPVRVKYIVFDKKTGSSTRAFDMAKSALDQFKAGYIAGYAFSYEKDGKVSLTVNASVSGKNDREMHQEIISVSNDEYVAITGEFEYQTPEYTANLKDTGQMSVEAGDNIHALYFRLLVSAIRETCRKGTKGVVFPVGDLAWSVRSDEVTIKGRFLISTG
jgi:hypothetical protein